jgi:branched-chain amino acid aminotransferase
MAMNECVGNYFILNGELQPVELFENSLVYEGESIYEVLKMVRGLPVFYFDHIDRLVKSASYQGKKMLAGVEKLRKDIISLTESDRKKEINLKIVFNYNNGSENYLVYYIPPIYPSPEQYRDGVKGILFNAERKVPESKVIDHRLRSEIYHKLILEGAYEVLLVTRNNCITEGSRSNIFFITGNKVVTAPETAVLHGITRKYILEICRENDITVEFECIKVNKITDYESVIMTGTSPVVLPFYRIDNNYFNVKHHLIGLLRSIYLGKAEESIKRFTLG